MATAKEDGETCLCELGALCTTETVRVYLLQ